MRRKKTKGGIIWQSAPDVKKRLIFLKKNLNLDWLKISRIYVFRSFNSSSRAIARTWAFPRIWQMALAEEPAYVIEVLNERYDTLPLRKQDEVLLHEVTHIPRNFSGSLLPHIRRGKNSFHKKVEELIHRYMMNGLG